MNLNTYRFAVSVFFRLNFNNGLSSKY